MANKYLKKTWHFKVLSTGPYTPITEGSFTGELEGFEEMAKQMKLNGYKFYEIKLQIEEIEEEEED